LEEDEKDAIELEKEDKNLEWKENLETGRSLLYTPLFSDGQYIYVISQRKAPKAKDEEGQKQQLKENKPPMLVVECYDPSTFRFVKDISLFKNEE